MEQPTKDDLLEWRNPDLVSVHRDVDDDWRHGCSIWEVFHRPKDDTYWGVSYRTSTDGEYHGIREDEYDVTQVYPKEVTKTIYVTEKVTEDV